MTVFSAPNYCGEFDNSGISIKIASMMVIDEKLKCSFKILRPAEARRNLL